MPLPKEKNADELGFKVGDKFRVVDSGGNFPVGTVVELTRDDGTVCPYFKNEHGLEYCVNFHRLEPLSKKIDHLQVGDVVLDSDDDERTVLAVLAPGLYCLSQYDDPNVYSFTSTAYSLKERGYTVNGAEPETEEMTMEEVCKALGKTIKIKKSD